MVARWKLHLESGAFGLSVPISTPLGAASNGDLSVQNAGFWTQPFAYWDMETRAAELWKELQGSGLVIFKVSLCLSTTHFSMFTDVRFKGDLK